MPILPASETLLDLVAVLLLGMAILLLGRSITRCRWSLAHPGHGEQSAALIAGIRLGILAGALVCFAVALLRGSATWAIFGSVFLGEELLETGLMLRALRSGRARPSAPLRERTKGARG